VDALIGWEFWAGVLLGGVLALASLLRWILWGDGRTPTRLSSIDPPLSFQQSPRTHAHPDAAAAPPVIARDTALSPTAVP